MNRGRGVQNIGLFAKWIDLEANLVGCFSPFRDTVYKSEQKWSPKRCQIGPESAESAESVSF